MTIEFVTRVDSPTEKLHHQDVVRYFSFFFQEINFNTYFIIRAAKGGLLFLFVPRFPNNNISHTLLQQLQENLPKEYFWKE